MIFVPSKQLGTVFAFVALSSFKTKEKPACAEEYAPTFLLLENKRGTSDDSIFCSPGSLS